MIPWPRSAPTDEDRARYAGSHLGSFWLDPVSGVPDAPPRDPLDADTTADLLIVGGGYTGLWAALHAKADDPDRDVLLLEAGRCGHAASGRNGGFCVASLTHGVENGQARFAGELPRLERLGLENHAGLIADLARHHIDAELEETGELGVAPDPTDTAWIAEGAALLRELGHDVVALDAEAVRAELDSPVLHGGLWDRTGAALVHPGKLAVGLRATALRLGVRIHEETAVTGLQVHGAGVRATAVPRAPVTVTARRVVLAAGAHLGGAGEPRPVPAVRRRIAPVWDHVLVTEPLTPGQRDRIGWRNRQGVGDVANLFHYFRLTADDRILWGGYDAVWRRGGPVDDRHEDHDPTYARLAQHFAVAFPQLDDVRFSHRWGGAIDTCSRFSAFFGTSHEGRVAHAVGYTGLGVAATRFGARVALDLLDGRATEATRTRYVRTRPMAFPPEPARTAAIRLVQNRMLAADRRGRQGPFLRLLARIGLGFDS
ncbi:MAG: FAD-dependent oxidoreductase [Solirubrobacteraceae bacterium]